MNGNPLYRIKNWDRVFENNKSRERDHCSWCPIPNKQDGLGYGLIMMEENGPALYGAFIAVVLMHSKSNRPRDGHLTDTGQADGRPLGPKEISIKTRVPADLIEQMLSVTSSESIGWIESAHQVPAECPPSVEEGKGREGKGREDSMSGAMNSSRTVLMFPTIGKIREWALTEDKVKEWESSYEGIDILAICKAARQWIIDNPKRKKTANGMTRFLGGWISREVNSGKAPHKTSGAQAIARTSDPHLIYRDFECMGGHLFTQKHGMTELEFVDRIRIDLADMTDGGYRKKYRKTKQEVRNYLDSGGYA